MVPVLAKKISSIWTCRAAIGSSVLVAFVLAALVLTAGPTQAQEPLSPWQTEVTSLGNSVIVQTVKIAGGATLTTVVFVDGRRIELDPLPPLSGAKALTPQAELAVRVESAKILDAAIELALADRLPGNVEVQDSRVAELKLNPAWAEAQGGQEVSLVPEQMPGSEVLNPRASSSVLTKFKKFFSFLNHALFISTYNAYQDFRATRRQHKGQDQERGIQIILKPEVQIGMGSINYMRALPMVFSISYDRKLRRVIFRRAIRKERMGEGSAISLGLKLEFRFFRRLEGALQFEGTTWYPPSPPFFGLVADSAPRYSSEGLVFGINVADFIPGSTVLNTENRWTETGTAHFTNVRAPKKWAEMLFAGTAIGEGYMCRQLFQAAH